MHANSRPLLFLTSALLTAGLGLSPVARAASANTPASPTLAATHPPGQTAGQLIGEDVRSTTGQDLGEIRDLTISSDGRIGYALISSGGILGVGDITRAVPFSAFTSTSTGPAKALAVDLGGADWTKAPIVRMDQLASLGTDARGREIHQYFGRPWPVGQTERPRAGAAQVRLASQIIGQQVMHHTETVGRIDDVYVHHDRALAVIDPADRTVAGQGKFVLGLDQLSWDAPAATVAQTSLTAADLAKAAPLPVDGLAVADQPYRWAPMRNDGRPLAPINEGDSSRLSTHGRASVAAVRDALQQDPTLAPAMHRVEVTPDGDQLRLTGIVGSEHLKDQLAREAARVAKGWTVKNDITVQSVAE